MYPSLITTHSTVPKPSYIRYGAALKTSPVDVLATHLYKPPDQINTMTLGELKGYYLAENPPASLTSITSIQTTVCNNPADSPVYPNTVIALIIFLMMHTKKTDSTTIEEGLKDGLVRPIVNRYCAIGKFPGQK